MWLQNDNFNVKTDHKISVFLLKLIFKLIKFKCFFPKKKVRIPILLLKISFIVSKQSYYNLQKKWWYSTKLNLYEIFGNNKLCFQIFHINLIKRVLEINHQSYQLLKMLWQ